MSPSTSCGSLTERLLRQNAELTGHISQLTEEKNDLRNMVMKLEEQIRCYRTGAGRDYVCLFLSWLHVKYLILNRIIGNFCKDDINNNNSYIYLFIICWELSLWQILGYICLKSLIHTQPCAWENWSQYSNEDVLISKVKYLATYGPTVLTCEEVFKRAFCLFLSFIS